MLVAASCGRREERAPPPGIEAAPRAEAASRRVLAEVTNQSPPVGVQVLDVRRVTPDTMRVELVVINRAAATATAAELDAFGAAIGRVAGVSIVNADGSRRTFPLRDPAGEMLWSGIEVPGPGERRPVWLLFPAPPAGAAGPVRIVVPGLPALAPVPVS